MKRRMAIFMVLLANIALLAHTVIPHHHHQLQVAVTCWHGEHVGHHAHKAEQEKHHHHACPEKAETCSIHEAAFILPRIQKDPDEGADAQHPMLFLPCLNCNIEAPFLHRITPKYTIDAVGEYLTLLTRSIGRRAPPNTLFS